MLEVEIQYVSLSYVARQARLNKSSLHRFLYDSKTIRRHTTDRILEALIRVHDHRVAQRIPRRNKAAIYRKDTTNGTVDELPARDAAGLRA